jgi:hypothetical protein
MSQNQPDTAQGAKEKDAMPSRATGGAIFAWAASRLLAARWLPFDSQLTAAHSPTESRL